MGRAGSGVEPASIGIEHNGARVDGAMTWRNGRGLGSVGSGGTLAAAPVPPPLPAPAPAPASVEVPLTGSNTEYREDWCHILPEPCNGHTFSLFLVLLTRSLSCQKLDDSAPPRSWFL
jgi:hypothetical protein